MPDIQNRLVLLGGGGVGKSALTTRLVTGKFYEFDQYDPTIDSSYPKVIMVDGSRALLEILDTPGQEEYSSMQETFMHEGQGFLLVYSTTQDSSFEEVGIFKERLLRAKDMDTVPMVLVGNKCDLENERQVTTEQGKKLAMDWGCPFMEVSAKEGIRYEECFHEAVREIRRMDVKPVGGRKKVGKKPSCAIL